VLALGCTRLHWRITASSVYSANVCVYVPKLVQLAVQLNDCFDAAIHTFRCNRRAASRIPIRMAPFLCVIILLPVFTCCRSWLGH
jgi:hypothetical protein